MRNVWKLEFLKSQVLDWRDGWVGEDLPYNLRANVWIPRTHIILDTVACDYNPNNPTVRCRGRDKRVPRSSWANLSGERQGGSVPSKVESEDSHEIIL